MEDDQRAKGSNETNINQVEFVTENLVFTALLSLPESLTKQQKVEQAEAVINQLGLTTYEPTSGLVSTTA
ncbi:hypothetical protein Tco_1168587 [Tanacetum coccineum]